MLQECPKPIIGNLPVKEYTKGSITSISMSSSTSTWVTVTSVTLEEGMIITLLDRQGSSYIPYGGIYKVQNGDVVDITDSSFTSRIYAQVSNGQLQIRQSYSSGTRLCVIMIAN